MLKAMTTPDGNPQRRTGRSSGGPEIPEVDTQSEEAALAAQFRSTPRGARLARQAAVRHLAACGLPPESDTSAAVALVVAELAANAVRHGRVPGRDFHLRIAVDDAAATVRVEVSDASPVGPSAPPEPLREAALDGESGRGLLLVDALAARWGVSSRNGVGKTVWARVPIGCESGSGGSGAV